MALLSSTKAHTIRKRERNHVNRLTDVNSAMRSTISNLINLMLFQSLYQWDFCSNPDKNF